MSEMCKHKVFMKEHASKRVAHATAAFTTSKATEPKERVKIRSLALGLNTSYPRDAAGAPTPKGLSKQPWYVQEKQTHVSLPTFKHGWGGATLPAEKALVQQVGQLSFPAYSRRLGSEFLWGELQRH